MPTILRIIWTILLLSGWVSLASSTGSGGDYLDGSSMAFNNDHEGEPISPYIPLTGVQNINAVSWQIPAHTPIAWDWTAAAIAALLIAIGVLMVIIAMTGSLNQGDRDDRRESEQRHLVK